MIATGRAAKHKTSELRREIGSFGDPSLGPTITLICGIHGNEPAGVCAAERVLEHLSRHQPTSRGRLIALIGNVTALSQGKRYIQEDLNRMWSQELDASAASEEALEAVQLKNAIDEIIQTSSKGILFLDLHTTSSDSKPFAIFGDTIRNRNLAMGLHVPLILGLEAVSYTHLTLPTIAKV